MSTLEGKTLIMLVSPSAMGKSTIVRKAIRLDPRFHRVRGFTTRKPRSDDTPDQFFYLTPDELEAERNLGEVVTELKFSTDGPTYGTLTSSFTGEFCLLETLAHSVDDYRLLDFDRSVTIAITSPAVLWRARFRERYPIENKDAARRLAEARRSIEWSLADSQTLWLVNDGEPSRMANRLIELVTMSGESDIAGPDYARECLEIIDSVY